MTPFLHVLLSLELRSIIYQIFTPPTPPPGNKENRIKRADTEEFVKQSSQIPETLKALVKQSNTQNRELEHVMERVKDMGNKV